MVREVLRQLPQYQIVYFGDTAHLPYGTKSKRAIQEFSDAAIGLLEKRGAKIILIACNTASSQAADFLRKKYPHLSIIDVISPTVEKIKQQSIKKIGVLATPGTVASGVYQKKLRNAKKEAVVQSCPLLVPFIEEGIVDGGTLETIIESYVVPLKKANIEGVVLGCTHYPLIARSIKKHLSQNIEVINPSKVIVEYLTEFLLKNKDIEKRLKKGTKHKFLVSDDPYKFEVISRLALGKKIKAKIIEA